jgi:hypothetical protein
MYTHTPPNNHPQFLAGDETAANEIHVGRHAAGITIVIIQKSTGTTIQRTYPVEQAAALLKTIEVRAGELRDLITILVGGGGSLADLNVWANCVEAAVNATPEKVAELRAAQSDELAPVASVNANEPATTEPATEAAPA